MKKVIIASKNPVKINAVKVGFKKMFPGKKFEFEGITVSSGVGDQPIGDHEVLKGAQNRAENAKADSQDANFWIGIEGGVEKVGDEMTAFAWIVVMTKNVCGKARTGTFFLPKKVTALINKGEELGKADDIVFGRTNSKQKDGAVGILTGGVIDRAKFYAEAVVLSLIPIKNSKMY